MPQLSQIKHIVVLMLENRSFDHMLGYLKLENVLPVNGLTGTESNVHSGVTYQPTHLTETIFDTDPLHAWDDVHDQVAGGNAGFVTNFAKVARANLGRIMGYHNATEVPIYNLLAKQYCVCDHWHAAVAGPTQPNRFYAIAGTSEGRKANATPPTLTARTVFHELTDRSISWKYYSHDLAFLRAHTDYRFTTGPIDKVNAFFQAARQGTLPSVSWIDPHFGIGVYPGRKNDDHPPHDVWEGQRLAGRVYNALLDGAGGALFNEVLFVITYDEHGGFYDHVPIGPAEDDYPDFRQYGVRVPALVISPLTDPGRVCSQHFDHTSIIRTILERFCALPGGGIPNMGKRVNAASSLLPALNRDVPRTDRPIAPPLLLNLEVVRREETAELVREPTDLEKELEVLRQECLSRGLTDEEL
jgi:phospholipase C